MSAIYGCQPLCSDTEKAFRPSSALGRRVAQVRIDVAFRLQASKRGVNGADGDLAANAHFDFLSHNDSVRLTSKTQQRKDNDVLELAEVVAV